jgi:hypothetical protein
LVTDEVLVVSEVGFTWTSVSSMLAAIGGVLPFFAGNHLLAFNNDFDTPEAIAVALTRPESALVFAGHAVVALGVGTLLLHRRDPD